MQRGRLAISSWSGGKDAALALFSAMEQGLVPAALLTMMIESGDRSRSHGLARSVLRAQATELDVPIYFTPTSWRDYTGAFEAIARKLASRGIHHAVFGDITGDEHRQWVEQVCARAGLSASLPLWHQPPRQVLDRFIHLGFEARIIAVRADLPAADLLGQRLDERTLARIIASGADPCGENGEYHTIVTAGPIFRKSLTVHLGATTLRDGTWFIDVDVRPAR